ncbi:uncharacterized protein [Panulirus ornatus]|uniref:uncharacterized protein n=1 Tax=Panulirus ornatus TaxID=150431 RepID=UPI003A87C621
MTGLPLEYFSSHTDPVVKTIYEKMEVLQVDEALQKVLAGGYSFIIFRNYISVIVATRYTDAQGHTPLYTSNEGVAMTSSFGWGFRRGAPFRSRFSQMIWHLRDAGIIDQWKTEVMARRIREKRREAAAAQNNNQNGNSATSHDENGSQVALGLHHLQGGFYLFLFGQGIALLTFLAEYLVHSRCPPRKPHFEENVTPLRILPRQPHLQQRNLTHYRKSYY